MSSPASGLLPPSTQLALELPSPDTALPLYVQEPGARVTKSGEVLVIEANERKTEVAAARPGTALGRP